MNIGQTVYLVNISYDKKRGQIKEGIVKKIGRKYITVESNFIYQFHKDTLREKSDYSPYYQLFESREAAENYVNKEKLLTELKRRMTSNELNLLSLEDLSLIKNILDNRKNNSES